MTLHVRRPGPLTTVQDRGRPGLAHLGVPRAGPLDRPAADLANRLLDNEPVAAVLEVTLGGLELTSDRGVWVALTGAPAPLLIDAAVRRHAHAEWLPAGGTLRVGLPTTGVRSYVALAGGVDVTSVLGSRATDTLAWVGPPRVVAGAELPVGDSAGRPAPHDTPRPPAPGPLRVHPGPRADWFAADALETLCATAYAVGAAS
ncbi:MAG: biotin-dependent carboxyltransferase family protein, partial [Nocardioides sp.]|nr:biotin-dependent carboxyltransferase family protein [Nocardioides sp.]